MQDPVVFIKLTDTVAYSGVGSLENPRRELEKQPGFG
jgi:hypothetical protein